MRAGRPSSGAVAATTIPAASAELGGPEGHREARVGLDLPHSRQLRHDRAHQHADRRRGHGEVVARPPSPRPRRRLGRRVAAHLERRGHVNGPVQRTGQRGARHQQPLGRLGPAAGGLAHAPGVAGQHRHQPYGQRGAERGAVGDAAEQPQQRVGIDGGGQQPERHHNGGDAQPGQRAGPHRLERDVPLAAEELAPADQQGVALGVDERVDHGHQQRQAAARAAPRGSSPSPPRRRRRPRTTRRSPPR